MNILQELQNIVPDKELPPVFPSLELDYPVWCDYYPDNKIRILKFNPYKIQTKAMLYHELGHVYNSDVLYNSVGDRWQQMYLTLRTNSEYRAQEWAIRKAKENNDWETLKDLISMVEDYKLYNKNSSEYAPYYWAFKILRKKL